MLSPLKKCLILFAKSKKGATTVEFTLTFVIFLAVLGGLAELARLSFLSAYTDSMTSLAVREVKNTEGISDYAQAVQDRLNKTQSNWNWLNNSEFTVDAKYYSSVDEIENGRATSDKDSRVWAEFTVNYDYHPMFSWFPQKTVGTLMQRKVLVLLEYEK